LVYLRCDAVDRVGLLAQHLGQRAESATGRTRVSYKLAACALKWWQGNRREAVSALEQLTGEAPADVGVSLVLAPGHYRQGDVARALSVLEKPPPVSSTWIAEYDGLRTLIVDRLCSGTIDQAFDGVLFLLRNTSGEPDLGFLFGDPARSARIPVPQA